MHINIFLFYFILCVWFLFTRDDQNVRSIDRAWRGHFFVSWFTPLTCREFSDGRTTKYRTFQSVTKRIGIKNMNISGDCSKMWAEHDLSCDISLSRERRYLIIVVVKLRQFPSPPAVLGLDKYTRSR